MSESITRKRQVRYRREQILNAALELFCKKGIEYTSIEDVAKASDVGVATIYRYFETKAELAIDSAVFYWEKTAEKYLKILKSPTYRQMTGRDQMECILDIFVQIFEKEFDFLKFVYEFDVFVMKYQIPQERLKEYELYILNLKPFVTETLERGLSDKSLYFEYTVEEIYFSVMHAMLSMMQKLAANGRMLPSDERVALSLQVKITGNLLLRGLENQEEKITERRRE